MNQSKNPVKLPFKTKLGYGAAELSSTLTWTMVSVLFLFYLTDIVGLDPAFAGFVLSIVGAYLLPMTRKRHEALKEAIQLKKEGRTWDKESLKEIL